MPINPLDKRTADAVCTVITIGFMAEQLQIVHEYQKTKFQYELTGNHQQQENIRQEHYDLYQLILRDTGLNIEFTPTQPNNEYPFVMAKSPTANLPEGIVAQAFNNSRAYWDQLELLANQDTAEPRGAYIGGAAQNTRFTVYGPSSLMTYDPMCRINSNLQEDYENMATEIVKAHSILEHLSNLAPLNHVTYTPGNIADADYLAVNNLFGSIHGMVNSMLRNPQPQENQVLVEYSLGPETTKVASCIPCSIFMSANKMPASSTHLGRGDFWNFPNPNSDLYRQMEAQQTIWGLNVIQHFNNGRRLLENVMNTNPALRDLIEVNIENNIPQLFLESLTFPGKFTDRIITTLTM